MSAPTPQDQGDPLGRFTDLGNATAFAERFGHCLRYVAPWRTWLIYSDIRWKRDERQEVYQLVKQFVRECCEEAAETTDESIRKSRLTWALKCHEVSRMDAILRLAQSELAAHPEDFDQDSYLFNLLNGTLELKTGTLRPHNPADMITRVSPVSFDPGATCPMWDRALATWFDGRADLIEFCCRWFGYCLTADTREQVFLMAYGPPAGGKTTSIETLLHLWGDYGVVMGFETLAAGHRDNGPREDLARLEGARLVTAMEVGAGKKFDEPRLKGLVGGDTFSARRLYEATVEIRPSFKIVIGTNLKPHVSGDGAVWRRLRMLPFDVPIPPEHRDLNLKAKLWAEAPGILRWLVEGCLRWQQDGLTLPPAVREATQEYRQDQDTLGAWVAECAIVDALATTRSRDLHKSYAAWAESTGEEPLTPDKFGRLLSERGYRKARQSGYRRGLKLRERTVEDGLDLIPVTLPSTPTRERFTETAPNRPQPSSAAGVGL